VTEACRPIRKTQLTSFSKETLNEHRRLKTSAWAQIRSARFLVILSVPLIYACVVPLALLDLFVAVYQWICFPIYGIPKVRRRDYLIFDRGRFGLSECDREGRLRLLFLRERIARLHRRNSGAHGTALLSDQACPFRGTTALPI
jgi:hypothetical protein